MIAQRDIDEAKGFPIVNIAERLGIEVRGDKAMCFKGHDEKSPSLSFHTGGNYYKCFGCGIGGDTISLVKEYTGKGFSDAVSFIIGREICTIQGTETKGREKGHPPAEGHRIGANSASAEKTAKNTPENAGKYHDIYAYLLHSTGYTSYDSEYLKGRGIRIEMLQGVEIKTITDAGKAAEALRAKYDSDTLRSAGLMNDAGTFALNSHRLLIPYFGADGKIITVKARNIDTDEKPKYRNLKGRPLSLYGINFIGKPLPHITGEGYEMKERDTVFICEGEIDAVTLWQSGRMAVAVSGVNNFRDEYAIPLLPYRIVIIGDNDDAGEVFAANVRDIFAGHRKGVEYFDRRAFGKCKDVNELLGGAA